MSGPSPKSILGRVFLEAKPYWPFLILILVLDVLAMPLALLAPVPLKIAVDSAIGAEPLPWPLSVPFGAAVSPGLALGIAVTLVVALAALSQVQRFGTWMLQSYTGERLALDFRARLFRHVQRLSLAYHDARGSADSIYRLQFDAPSIQWVAVYGIAPFITAAMTLIGMIAVMMRLDHQIALVALAVVPPLFYLTRHFASRIRQRWHDAKQLGSSAAAVVQEVLTSLRVVKAFAQEQREEQRFVDRAAREVRANIGVIRLQSLFFGTVALLLAAGTAIALYLGVSHVRAGVLTLGELIMVMAYLAQLYGPLEAVSNKLTELQNSLASAERALSLLDHAPDVTDRPGARPLERARGEIEFRDVCFSYGAAPPVLENISARFEAGTRIGIVGRTGAGKTTLVNLVTRFYDPSRGSVLLDGVDLRDWRLEDLRNQFAIVLQEPVLFSSSIRENIAYGRPGATDVEITAAAQAANAHDFISALPDGYRTEVGERGMRISGGERQRIALARAFLKDAPVLILDEPTSAVDMKTEASIVDALERLMQGRTTFIIAHRLSTIRHCDLVFAIEGGGLTVSTSDATEPLLRNRGLSVISGGGDS